MPRQHLLRLLLVAGCLGLVGCSEDPPNLFVQNPDALPPPEPNSPAQVIRALEWAWNHRDQDVFESLLTDDFRFVFSALDTNGNAYRDAPWTREYELESFRHLMCCDHPTEPPAVDCRLEFDRNLFAFPDPRPGKDPAVHKLIRTTVSLNLTLLDGNTVTVQGRAAFFVVRGDSAQIPPALGLPPDASRWWIERWEEETDPGVTAASNLSPQPSPHFTWGAIKVLYR